MTSAIVCAAGLSRRMGQPNKIMLPYKGKIILLHCLEQVIKSQVDEVIVVLGHESEKVRHLLHPIKESISIFINKDYIKGQTSSIQQGVIAAHEQSESFLICLADMPMITTEHYNQLIDNYKATLATHQYPIVRPVSEGPNGKSPGHPVLMHSFYKEEILNCTDQEGCRSVIKKAQKSFVPWVTNQPSYFYDIDTPRAYEHLISNNHDS